MADKLFPDSGEIIESMASIFQQEVFMADILLERAANEKEIAEHINKITLSCAQQILIIEEERDTLRAKVTELEASLNVAMEINSYNDDEYIKGCELTLSQNIQLLGVLGFHEAASHLAKLREKPSGNEGKGG